MEGLFENIRFLIPLALIIAVQVVRARNARTKHQQKKSGGLGELIKKIQEAQANPEYGKALTEATEVYIPPKPAQQAKTAKKPIPKPIRQPARPIEVKKANKNLPKKQLAQSELKTKYSEAAEAKVSRYISSEEDTRGDSAAAASVTQHSLQTGLSLQGLTPLQQAVVWSEILGQPKGVSAL